MPLVQTRGAASAQGFGEFAQATVANYIEDVFSTYLYTGTASTLAITNGIDLSANGWLVWVKRRNSTTNHVLVDNSRPLNKYLASNLTNGNIGPGWPAFVFNNNGFNLPSGNYGEVNTTAGDYASWTFRKQPKFFDVVTWTGDGDAGRQIPHSLGSSPGVAIVKRTDTTGDWKYTAFAIGSVLRLNATDAADTAGNLAGGFIGSRTSTTIALTSWLGSMSAVNASGGTYVAYLFASNAGGFGLTGTDNVISCGSFTTDGSANATVSLGYEPQLVMWKSSTASDLWQISDTMRGWSNRSGGRNWLRANESDAETAGGDGFPTSTGFEARGLSGSQTYIYIAIRRGPMKVPTLGTSVFKPMTTTGDGNSVRSFTGVGFPPDLVFPIMRASPGNHYLGDRLRGSPKLETTSTVAEGSGYVKSYDQDGWTTQADSFGNSFGFAFIDYLFRRAPGFFDEVCYTGTGVARTVTHNLGVAPELIFVKWRTGAPFNWQWGCYDAPSGAGYYMRLNSSDGNATSSVLWNDTAPTASVFTVGTGVNTNENNTTYVAYLFATCAGVSKVFSYTGNGSSQTINCGFTGGARFVMIKRTDSTGDWYVWDSARGIVAGNDPHLSLNTTAAEVTTDDSVDTDNTGFVVNQLSATNVNVTSATYIGLAIA
jgi:hypothetical protein